MNNLPRYPVHAVPGNQHLIKADAGQTKVATDYHQDGTLDNGSVSGPTAPRIPYRRSLGNVLFRRYTNGVLDLEEAAQKVVSAIHILKQDSVPLLPQDALALVAVFPNVPAIYACAVGMGIIPEQAMMLARLAPFEVNAIQNRVAAHLKEEENWNAGQGGGSIPGRSTTYI